MRSVGIDIGTYSVKVCAVENTKKGLFVTHLIEKPILNANPFDRDLEVIEFLRSELSIFDPLQTRFTLGLPQDLISVRTKNFPFKDRQKILKSLPFELEEDLPFNTEDTLFDGRIIQMDQAQSEVLAVATPSEIVKKFVQHMNDCNIQISLLSPDAIAFSNHFTRWNEPIPISQDMNPMMDLTEEEKDTRPLRHCRLIVSIGHHRSSLMLLEGEKLIDVRTISWGAQLVAEAISKKYDIPIQEAYKQLQANSFILTNTDGATPDQIFYSSLIAGVTADLVKELKFTILEFQSMNHCLIGAVDITGGFSKLQNLGAHLTQGLELPVNKVSILELYENLNFEKTTHNDAICGTALGLAIEGLRKPRNPALSLLRGEYSQKSHKLHSFLTKWAPTLKYAAMLFVAFYIYTSLRDSFSLTMVDEAVVVMQDQGRVLANLKGSKANEANINKFIKEKKKVIQELKTISNLATMNSAASILKKINDALPPKQILTIEMSKLSINENKVVLEGYVPQPKDVTMVQSSLKGIALDSKILTPPSQLPPMGGRVTFKMEFDVDRNVQRMKK